MLHTQPARMAICTSLSLKVQTKIERDKSKKQSRNIADRLVGKPCCYAHVSLKEKTKIIEARGQFKRQKIYCYTVFPLARSKTTICSTLTFKNRYTNHGIFLLLQGKPTCFLAVKTFDGFVS